MKKYMISIVILTFTLLNITCVYADNVGQSASGSFYFSSDYSYKFRANANNLYTITSNSGELGYSYLNFRAPTEYLYSPQDGVAHIHVVYNDNGNTYGSSIGIYYREGNKYADADMLNREYVYSTPTTSSLFTQYVKNMFISINSSLSNDSNRSIVIDIVTDSKSLSQYFDKSIQIQFSPRGNTEFSAYVLYEIIPTTNALGAEAINDNLQNIGEKISNIDANVDDILNDINNANSIDISDIDDQTNNDNLKKVNDNTVNDSKYMFDNLKTSINQIKHIDVDTYDSDDTGFFDRFFHIIESEPILTLIISLSSICMILILFLR